MKLDDFPKDIQTRLMPAHAGRMAYRCLGCSARFGIERLLYVCPECGQVLYIWAGILTVRALGGALHPLGSGLVALGWRDVLRGEKDSGKNWWKRFGIAATVHAVWNGGSLLVITLGGARFFGELPPEIDLLGLSAAGTTLAFLIPGDHRPMDRACLWTRQTHPCCGG